MAEMAVEYREQVHKEVVRTCIPFYEQILLWMDHKYHLPRLVSILILALSPYLIGLLFLSFTGSDLRAYTSFWLKVNFSAWIAGMFLFMSYIYNKTVDLLDDFLFVLDQKNQVNTVCACYRLMFVSKGQILTGVIWGIIIALVGLSMGVPLDVWGTAYLAVSAFVAGFLISTGFWYTVTSAIFIHRYSQFTKISFNIIDPSRTIGIREMANLMGTWGICAVLQAVLILFGFYFPDWGFSPHVIDLMHFFWTMFIFVLILFIFIFPHTCIKRMIVSGKRMGARKYHRLISEVSDRITSTSTSDLDDVEKSLTLLNQCQDVYQNISRSPSFAMDISVIGKFFSALIVPILIALFDRPEIIYALVDFFRP